MTEDDINRQAALFAAAGRINIPVPISEWRETQMARIAVASVKTNPATGRRTVKPIDTAPRHARLARDGKADRAERQWLEAKSKEYGHGRTAYAKGKEVTDCPHDGRTKLARNWIKGWEDARSDARKAARKRA